MTGFEPGSSGIGSDHSANCATTTSQVPYCLYLLKAPTKTYRLPIIPFNLIYRFLNLQNCAWSFEWRGEEEVREGTA